VEVAPGASAELTLVLSNPGTFPVELHSYTANVHTAVNGGLTMEPAGSELAAPATWMEFPSETVALEPGQEATRVFTVNIPAETPPGQYPNAVAVETVGDYAVEGSSNFRQRIRKVLPVLITVPGEVEAGFVLGEPIVETSRRWPVLQIPIENTGNIRVRPQGELTVKDPTGVELLKTLVTVGYIYAGDATLIEIIMNPALPPGDYEINLQMADESTGTSHSLSGMALVMPEFGDQELAPVAFENVTIAPNAEPIQFANVSVDLVNNQDAVRGAALTLSVFKDGQHVEDFVLDDGFTLPPGTTTVEQRYIPMTGFESGTYTFSLVLGAVDPANRVSTTLLTVDDVATLEVP
jgi:hypothetical protein